MKIFSEKEGASNIKILILFLFVIATLVILGVSMFAWPRGTIVPGDRLEVNITEIKDANANNATKMNGTEYLANTSFTVTIQMNGSAVTDAEIDLYYDVDATPDGNGGSTSDCKQDTASGSGSGPWAFTIPAGGATNCVITDGSKVAILIEVDGNQYYANYSTNAGVNETWNFTVDGATPSYSTILTPSTDNTWSTNGVIGFNTSDSVTTNLNYRFYINATRNTTGNITHTTHTILNATLTGLAEGGYYSVILEVIDNISNKLNSSPRTLYYDPTAPTIADIKGIANGTVINTMTIQLNLSDGSNVSSLNYTIYVNASYNVSGAGNNSLIDVVNRRTTTAVTGLLDGNYYQLYVAATDTASNTRNITGNNISFWYDAANPGLSNITYPITDNSWINKANLTFKGNDTTTVPTLNYTFYINNTRNTTGANLTSNADLSDYLTGLAEGGYYNVTLEIIDNVSNKLNSSRRTFWYDPTEPSKAVVISLVNNSWINSVNININVTDGAGQPLTYAVYTNNTLNKTASNGSNSGTTTLALTGLFDGGAYNISVAAIDNASNVRNDTNNTFRFWYDATAPTQSVIVTPASNNTWVSSIVIGFNGSDVIAAKLNYTLYINGTRNVTGSNLTNSTNLNVSMTGTFAEGGYYSVIVGVRDNASNELNSSPITLYYDGTGPQIIPVNVNKTKTSSRLVSFWVIDGANNTANKVNQSSITVVGTGITSVGAFNSSSMCTLLTNGSSGYLCSYIENGLEPGAASPQLIIDANDNASNSATDYYLEMNVTAGFKYNVTLASGWNLVSTPLILVNSSLTNVLANNSNISSVYYFDGSSWTSWTSAAPCSSGSSCVTTISPLEGYWVYTTAATKMQFFGNKTTGTPPRGYGLSNPRSLSASTWNLIGYYSTGYADNINTDDALADLCGSTGGRKCSDGDRKFDVLAWYDTDNSLLNSTIQSTWDEDAVWDKGRGFWIYMNAADTLSGTP